jgi:DNA (cytosine-5)-methyltransferase 1
MIGAKIDIKVYGTAGELMKKRNGFTLEEVLISHFEYLSGEPKKIAKNFFKNNIYPTNGFHGLKLEEAIQEYLFEIKANVPFPGPSWGEEKFTFIDLFAGIGGFRLALQDLGGKCVFSSEWDKAAQETYKANFGEIPFGDITKLETQNCIPKKFDILCAGFPCQPFSRAGVSARNFLGLKHGFDHPTQGNLFFEIVKIAIKYKPRVLFLENVKNLKSHDGGETFKTIEKMIREIGYSFFPAVINAETEVPQRRERTYMVCFKNKDINFSFPEFKGTPKKLINYLEKDVPDWYTLSDAMWQGHIKRSKRNKERGTGFTTSVADLSKPSNTIVARYYKDGKECLIPQLAKNPRMLTPRECARLQGFPKQFIYHQSRKAAYQQFGNSVAVPVIRKIAKQIISHLSL